VRESIAAFLSVPASIGYPVLFALVAAESAGALVPGETALIVAGALAGRGHLSLPLVIVTGAAAAILGDNVGYVIGRKGLRRLLDRPGWFGEGRRRAVSRGDEFFARHGPATVFFGRWLPGIRVVVAWLAGTERLSWRRFLLWNSLGGIAWSASITTVAYTVGKIASGYLGLIGLGGLARLQWCFSPAGCIAHRRRHDGKGLRKWPSSGGRQGSAQRSASWGGRAYASSPVCWGVPSVRGSWCSSRPCSR
jgi:membrane protein DedA with SNARE-associated domain